jgi:hypothetical protein
VGRYLASGWRKAGLAVEEEAGVADVEQVAERPLSACTDVHFPSPAAGGGGDGEVELIQRFGRVEMESWVG